MLTSLPPSPTAITTRPLAFFTCATMSAYASAALASLTFCLGVMRQQITALQRIASLKKSGATVAPSSVGSMQSVSA